MAPTPTNADDVTVRQEDRNAAADAVKAYRDRKNGDWQQRIRDGKCDDGEMVQAFARHRTAHQSTEVERLREALVEAAIPLEALLLAGIERMSPEMQNGIRNGVAKIRAALAIKGE